MLQWLYRTQYVQLSARDLGTIRGEDNTPCKKIKIYGRRLPRSIAGGEGLFCSHDVVSLFINIPTTTHVTLQWLYRTQYVQLSAKDFGTIRGEDKTPCQKIQTLHKTYKEYCWRRRTVLLKWCISVHKHPYPELSRSYQTKVSERQYPKRSIPS